MWEVSRSASPRLRPFPRETVNTMQIAETRFSAHQRSTAQPTCIMHSGATLATATLPEQWRGRIDPVGGHVDV